MEAKYSELKTELLSKINTESSIMGAKLTKILQGETTKGAGFSIPTLNG